jgi:xylulokinase
MIPVLLGIDVGTSSVKAVVLSTGGAVLAAHAVPYATRVPRHGWSEQEPRAWWSAAGEASRAAWALVRTGQERPEVVGIGLSGQMHTFVLVAADGRPLRPAISWMDTRAEPLLAPVRETIAAAGLADHLANPVVLGLTLLPLVWLRDHEPAVVHEARALLTAKDYLRWRMTGELGAEPTDASATLLCDVAARRWSPQVMAAFDLPFGLLPVMGESASVAGVLTPEAAEHLGLAPGIPVAFGAGDQQAAALGMGTVHPNQVQLTVGTGAQVTAVRERPAPDPAGRLHAFCHVRGWTTQASVNNAGSALDWARTLLGLEWEQVYEDLGRGGGPLFVPYLTGERTPLMKGHALGAWLGLAPGHGPGDLARAAGEGVVAAIAEAVLTVTAGARPAGAVRAAGGGMRHEAFAQAIADATGLDIEVHASHDASGAGAALLGGIAGGVFANVDEAAEHAPSRVAATYHATAERGPWWAARRETLRRVDAIGLHEVVADAVQEA